MIVPKPAILLLLLLGWPGVFLGQARPVEPGGLDAAARGQVVDGIVRELRARYVLPDAVPRIEADLRARLRSGAYDGATTPEKLAEALSEDLRKASGDQHLSLVHDPARAGRLLAAKAATGAIPQDLDPTPEEIESARRNNFGFRKVEILSGNVGYLDLRVFVDLKLSEKTAAAAMGFLANADAVILDLRQNPGGYVNVEDFLISHFFGPRPVELFSIHDQPTNRTTRKFTLSKLPGKRLERAPVYVLTSGRSASASEAVALTLQLAGRATVIGEHTLGAGHGAMEVPLEGGFVLGVSSYYQFNPRTGKGWEGTGVEPDIAVPADRALNVAHLEAVKRLAASTTDGATEQKLVWLEPLLELQARGPKEVAAASLRRYEGPYEGAEILLEEGRLYFLGASGVRRNLLALSGTDFLIEDASVPPENQARVRFIADAEGNVTGLRLLVPDGRIIPRARRAR